MTSFQNPFWPGMQGIADLPKQIEGLTQSLAGFLEAHLPQDQAKTMASLTPPAEKFQP